MKTIKRERQVRLDELIKHCIDNDTFGSKGVFTSATGKVNVTIYKDDVVIEDAYTDFNIIKTLFTITEEVDITEDTLLDVILVYDEFSENKNHVGRVFRVSVNQITKINTDGNIKFIYLQNEDGSIGDLIWSKECGLID